MGIIQARNARKTLIVLIVTISRCMFALARLDLSRVMTETAQGELRAAPALTIFGPVPSRRLGRSLGIGNVPVPVTYRDHVFYVRRFV